MVVASEEKSKGAEEAPDLTVQATDLSRIIESSILSFRRFVKMEKKKTGGVRNIFGSQNQIMATPVQQIQYSLDKVKPFFILLQLNFVVIVLELAKSGYILENYRKQ